MRSAVVISYVPVNLHIYRHTATHAEAAQVRAHIEETAGILGTIRMYRETSFLSTRGTFKGWDNRARARCMGDAMERSTRAVCGVRLESKRGIRLRGVQMASKSRAAKSFVSRVDACK